MTRTEVQEPVPVVPAVSGGRDLEARIGSRHRRGQDRVFG